MKPNLFFLVYVSSFLSYLFFLLMIYNLHLLTNEHTQIIAKFSFLLSKIYVPLFVFSFTCLLHCKKTKIMCSALQLSSTLSCPFIVHITFPTNGTSICSVLAPFFRSFDLCNVVNRYANFMPTL